MNKSPVLQPTVLAGILCLALACTAPAEAMPIEGTCAGVADTTVTCDTDTQLEWLDLGLTTGFSAAEILGGAGGFITEWRFASFSEVDQLFLSAGWDGVDQTVDGTDSVAMAGPAGLLVTLMGTSFGNFGQGMAATADPTRFATPFFQVFPSTGNVITGRFGCTGGVFPGDCPGLRLDDAFATVGSFLVRDAAADVPEPTTLGLLGAGLLVLLFARRTRAYAI